ncbi:hypothetical protein [Pusillimonas sp.]|uniref:hypothetical protein n=1 Tax=Pusillimonas sp. TaxID=3040095 RepID=UPI0037CB8588
MAGDYGLDSNGKVVIQEPANTGTGPATRLTGGGASFSGFAQASQAPGSNFGAIADPTLKTLDALNKLTSGMLQPLIEDAKKKQYFEGMAQVAQGKTLIEIQKEQPWYTRIFGPSATVQGAQAMTLMGAMNQAEAQFYQELPKLAQQPPDVARAFLVQQAAELSNTGDAVMDAMLQAKLAEQFGPMMNAHMKQHYKYIQEQNNLAFGNNLMTAGDAYQQKLGQTGFFTPEQLEMEKIRAVEAFTPLEGMEHDAWQKATAQALTANMMKGNFGIVEAFKETDLYQKLPLNVRTQLETQVEPYAAQWVQRNLPAFRQDAYDLVSLELALSQGTGPQTLEALDAWIEVANEKWAVESGSSEPRFNNNQRAALVAAWHKGQLFREKQEAAARAHAGKMEAEYQDAAAQQTAALFAANNNGALPPNHSKIAPENVQSIYRKVREDLEQAGDQSGLNNWLGKLAVVSNNGSKWLDQDLSMRMTTSANNFLQQGIAVSDEMLRDLQYMHAMAQAPNGLAGLANYIGATNATKMTALIKSGVDLSDRDALDTVRVSIARGWEADPTAKDRKAVLRYLEGEDTFLQRNLPIFGTGALTGYNLNEPSKQRLGELLAPTAARLVKGNGLSMEEAIPLAFSLMFGNSSKIDYVDGSFTEPNPASEFRSMFSVVSEKANVQSQASEDYQKALTNVIDKAMAQAIGKVPVDMSKDLTSVDRLGNRVAGIANDALSLLTPFTGNVDVFDARGRMQSDPDKFDPSDYVTATVTPIDSGVLQVHRIPRNPGPDARPVTVVITADQVIAELESLYKTRAEWQRQVRETQHDPYPHLSEQYR